MIREDAFVLSRKQFAIDLGSLRIGALEQRFDGSPIAWCSVSAVWYRRKSGQMRVSVGYLRDLIAPPVDISEFLDGFDHDPWGGHCEGRWDGKRYWGSEEPAVQEAHLKLLRPLMAGNPAVPEGYDGWWRFLTTEERERKRLAH
jgi:hypothetical protein